MNSSIAMCLYNGSKYIIEQLDSIKEQSVQPYRVLISDDGSRDNGPEIVKQYIRDNGLDSRWAIKVNEKNKGYACNFVETADSVEGDVVFFCDQDDIWDKNKIETMTQIMEDHPEINLLCSNLEPFYFEEDTVRWDPKVLASMKNDGSIEYCDISPDNFHLKRSGCTMCIRKDFLHRILPYWKTGWAHDDFVWKFAVLSGSCAILHYYSLKRRMHSSNTTVIRKRTRIGRIQQLSEFDTQYEQLIQFAKELNLDSRTISIIKKNKKSLRLRKDLIERKHIWLWPILFLHYADCYPRRKGLYLDAYLTLCESYNNVN